MAKITKKEYGRRLGIWLAWMRDPATRQGRGRLRSGSDNYCCLGGLCELSGKGHWTVSDVQGPFWVDDLANQESATFPTKNVAEWIGFINEHGTFTDGMAIDARWVYGLADLNDELVWDLPAIADWIEEHEEVLFSWAVKR